MKLSDLKSSEESLAEALRDEGFRREWERTALSGGVALHLVKYRAEHGLSQRALAAKLGMKQPAIARLEAGDHNPSIETLVRLAGGLGMRIRLDITPDRPLAVAIDTADGVGSGADSSIDEASEVASLGPAGGVGHHVAASSAGDRRAPARRTPRTA